jgi:glycosyltransferase involved in cell wall biosynthesis
VIEGTRGLRVLHCPTSTGGNAWGLARAERALGLDSFVLYYSDLLGYPCDCNLNLERRSRIAREWQKWLAVAKSLRSFDVVHFNYGNSFLSYSQFGWDHPDVPFLHRFGKKIVMTYQGDDIRQRDFCLKHFAITFHREADYNSGVHPERLDAIKRRKLNKIAAYTSRIFAVNPDLLHVLPAGAEFLPYANVDIRRWSVSKPVGDGKIRILHAPTDRITKGSKYIIAALEALARKDPRVEPVIVENLAHGKVRSLYEQADVAVDQLLAGWYGGFAVEMMALGKPVVCYIREDDLKFIPKGMRDDLPIVNATPGTIGAVLEALVESKANLVRIGEAGRAYVEKWHDPMQVAKRTMAEYLR